jgi:predicted dithiol-disulfide oxidoreductase (DUF899 family)
MPEPKYPNESSAYRAARQELLQAEADLRERVERVAALRRALPLGGEVSKDYRFQGAGGPVTLSQLFADGKDSLFVYSYMFGPQMKAPCPLCTSFLDSLDAQAPHIERRINLVVSAKSPYERIASVARDRGWRHLRLMSDGESSYHADYLGEAPDGSQLPMANVFVRRNGKIYHFWGSELFFVPNKAGDPRHIDMMWPLWNVLDTTPDGRGSFYPSLAY